VAVPLGRQFLLDGRQCATAQRPALRHGHYGLTTMRYAANNRKGFTLVEILVVLLLTIIILGLVFGPVIGTFNFTRRAETMVRAQDNARFALEQISRELADAMFVYDNTNQPINFPMLGASGTTVPVPVLYAKVDIVLPRMRGYCTNTAHTAPPKEFMRHDPNYPELDESIPNCPTCGAPLELRPAQPMAADRFIVRYFIGLRDPSLPYSNPYTDRFSQGKDNMFVLYRVEFSPFDKRLFGNDADAAHFAQNMSDPNFFYGTHSAAWRELSRPVVTLENTDLIVQEFSGGAAVFVPGTGFPVITPTVKFTPTAVYNDPLLATSDFGDDPEHGDTLPTVYKATYGYWTTPIEITLSGRKDNNGGPIIYKARKQPGQACGLYKYPTPTSTGNLIFDISNYLATKADPSYDGCKYGVGEFLPVTKPEVAFTIDETRGTVDFAFPVVDTKASDSLTSAQGRMAVSMIVNTDKINTDYRDAFGAAFKDRYRWQWINDPSPTPPDPPNPSPIAEGTVVPGSERIVAPDSAPGPHYGLPIRYARVPSYLYEPGLNQYQLDVNYQAVEPDSSPDGYQVLDKPGLACLFFHSYQTHQPGSGVELPPGKQLFIYYEVQNNKKDDTLRANYVTKSLMTVIMGIRIYDPSSGKPQAIQLTNKVRLRNIAQ